MSVETIGDCIVYRMLDMIRYLVCSFENAHLCLSILYWKIVSRKRPGESQQSGTDYRETDQKRCNPGSSVIFFLICSEGAGDGTKLAKLARSETMAERSISSMYRAPFLCLTALAIFA